MPTCPIRVMHNPENLRRSHPGQDSHGSCWGVLPGGRPKILPGKRYILLRQRVEPCSMGQLLTPLLPPMRKSVGGSQWEYPFSARFWNPRTRRGFEQPNQGAVKAATHQEGSMPGAI
jgi:hypothetical protein